MPLARINRFTVFPVPARKQARRAVPWPGNETWSQQASLQGSCPLFNKIPAEIRSIIYKYVLFIHNDCFVFAVCQVDDGSAAVRDLLGPTRQIYRPPPGKRGYDESALNILQTCQAIYAETCSSVVSANTHVLLYPLLRSMSFRLSTHARKYFSRMTTSQIQQVKQMHLFVGSSRFKTYYDTDQALGGYRSESPFAELSILRNGPYNRPRSSLVIPYMPIHPQLLTITIRHYDWARVHLFPVSNDYPCTLTGMFLQNQKWETLFGSLQCLVIELEIETKFKEPLTDEIRKLMDFEFDVGDNGRLVPRRTREEVIWKHPLASKEEVEIEKEQEEDMSEKSNSMGSDRNAPDVKVLRTGYTELTVYIITWDLVGGNCEH